MNLEIFNNPDPSGRMSKESFLFKNYKDEYDYIVEYCLSNNILEISFKEKVYLCFNNISNIPTCQNPSCKKRVSFKNSTLGYLKYCSNKCISSDPNIKKIKEEKSLEKFGTKTPAESEQVKNKTKKTNQERYGGNSAMSSEEIQEKSKQTLLKNWGVDNPNKSPYLIEKRIESFKLSNYKESFKKTSLFRYGVDHPWKNKDIHDKSSLGTFISKNLKLKESILKKLETHSNYKLISIDYDKYKREVIIHCDICNSEFFINREDFHIRHKNKTTICTVCNPIDTNQSGTEMKLYEFIKDNFNGNIHTNIKSIIKPSELDIYIPDLKLAFEFNGLYWHSESQKGKYYHYDKTRKCRDIGIELIHIWEDDWVYKNDIVKSIILNRIGKTKNKIYARKCEIREVNDIDLIKYFLENNHILGYCSSSIKLGLYYNDDLVSLMCFTKKNGLYELVRYCNKLNNLVTGGSSKLFIYFINKYKTDIISYSDESMFSGNLYESLGFKHISNSVVNYKWVIGKKREHKSKYRKDRLVKSGFDVNKSENDIMIDDVGAYKIWDCGLKKWIYKCS